MDYSETDLYEPIRRFLEAEGYTVQAEVKGCDIAAKKEGHLIVIELKKRFSLKLVYQAMERQTMTESVFVAIPRPVKGQRDKSWKNMLWLLKRLEIGLLTVAIDSPLKMVDVVLEPSDSMVWKKRKKEEMLIAEMEGRKLSVNTGGMTRKKIMTAYREKAIALACILEQNGEVSLKELRAMGMDEKFTVILQRNPYQWFVRCKAGVYRLSEVGKAALEDADYESVVAYYRGQYQKAGGKEI